MWRLTIVLCRYFAYSFTKIQSYQNARFDWNQNQWKKQKKLKLKENQKKNCYCINFDFFAQTWKKQNSQSKLSYPFTNLDGFIDRIRE